MPTVMPNIADPDLYDPDLFDESIFETDADVARPWVVIVWDDPINTMQYVTLVFQKVFSYPKAKAEKHMKEVHYQGKSVLFSGAREHAEMYVTQLHQFGLWATLQQD
jgi:ATP-dependent Clp protease adaptor protein ClpS